MGSHMFPALFPLIVQEKFMVDWISAKATTATTATTVPMTATTIIAKLHEDYIVTYHHYLMILM